MVTPRGRPHIGRMERLRAPEALGAGARGLTGGRLDRRGGGQRSGMHLVRRLAVRIPQLMGSPLAFLVAIVLVAAWIVWGLAGGFTNAWLLWPSAIASVVTFLIAFSLQYTQNRDTRAIQLKLDEILRAHQGARSDLIKLECLDDEQLEQVEDDLTQARRSAARSSGSRN
jgi:low affinity Fe/Cu permease